MNDPFEFVDRLAAHARQESLPVVDVADRVIPRLRQRTPLPIKPMAVFASGVAVAAILTAVVCLPLIDMFVDPWSVYVLSYVGVFY